MDGDIRKELTYGRHRIVLRPHPKDFAHILECYKDGRFAWAMRSVRELNSIDSEFAAIDDFELDTNLGTVNAYLRIIHTCNSTETRKTIPIALDSGKGTSIYGRLLPYAIETYSVQLVEFSKEFYAQFITDPTRLRKLSAPDFERLIADRLRAMGFEVQLVGHTFAPDGGVDFVAWPKDPRPFPCLLAGQVKHHRTERNTGVADVRAFAGVLNSGNSFFHMGVVVTNTGFTPDARWFAEHNASLLRLRDIEDLVRWMKDDFANPHEWREIPEYLDLGPRVRVRIPRPPGPTQSR